MADNWNSIPLAAIGSGLVDVPQRSTFADVMDPYERAAYTLRRKYGTQVPGPSELATPEEQRQAAFSLVSANPVMRGIAMAPRVATGLGALGAYLYGTDQAGANEPDMVKQLQTELKAKGYYSGPIDGVMGKGTQAAKDKFDAAEALRAQRELVEAQKTAAQAAIGETERLKEEARIKAEQRAQGGERLKQIEGEVPTWRKALRDYATPVGYGLGAAAGVGARALVTKVANKISANTANKAEALFEGGTNTIPSRVGRTNEFWRKGGGEVPFISAPNSPKGFAVNPGATAMDKLYPAPTKWNALTDLGTVGVFGGESAAGQFLVAPEAHEELKAARAAVENDPSEGNINRLQAAIDKSSMADFMTSFGRGGVGGYATAATKMQRSPTTPAMDKAEAEKLKLEAYLRTKPRGSRTKSVPPPSSGETLGDILSVRTTQQRLLPPDK
jgi:peptidoglycan hydrolase-like protein with peptidoglycan-binding domain